MGSSKKSCSKGILESCGLPGAKRIFAMEYQDKGPSLCKFSRYFVVIKIMDIRHKICHIYYKNADFESFFLAKKFTILLLYVCQVFINVQDHLHFFLHFVFSFMGQLFMDDPISYFDFSIFRSDAMWCWEIIFHGRIWTDCLDKLSE